MRLTHEITLFYTIIRSGKETRQLMPFYLPDINVDLPQAIGQVLVSSPVPSCIIYLTEIIMYNSIFANNDSQNDRSQYVCINENIHTEH